jgi:hypothetical protein
LRHGEKPVEGYLSQAGLEAAIRGLAHEHATYEQVAAGVCYGSSDVATLNSAWHAYQAAKYAGPVVVFGRDYDYKHRLIEDYPWIESCDESFPCMDKRLVDNVGLVNEAVAVEATGGVLHLDKWSCAANDAYVLGLIHHGRDIHFTSPRSQANICSKGQRHPVSVNGRELIGLDACGRYRFVTAGTSGNVVGEAAQLMHSRETRAFGFPEYLASIRKYLGNPALLERLWTLEPEPLAVSPVRPALQLSKGA